jgi:hypothetical protein
MAFLKYARAQVVTPQLRGLEWDKIRVASGAKSLDASLKKKAEEILGEPFTPDRFLLTHSTIVCSVDAVPVPNVKTGSIEEEGQSINRKYADYRVTSDTDKYINNNLDCWSRGVIKKSYKTFVGAHNFVEHVQVEELSKGRIIDAVMRDVGESIYVDILVATDRKHTELVNQILSGDMNGMSMGCSVDFTICTKCGHVAADEPQMCKHVKYEKGNWFFDESGNKHRVAELCGHETTGETGGVTFIEASWVAVPAFKGAVARNTLEIPDSPTPPSAEETLNQVPSEWLSKSASSRVAGPFDFGDDEGEGEEKKEPPKPDSILEELEGVVRDALVERLKKKLDKEIKTELAEKALNVPATSDPTTADDTIIKEGSGLSAKKQRLYFSALDRAVRIASSDAEAIENIRLVNDRFDVYLPSYLYRIATALGSAGKYKKVANFLSEAEKLHGRKLTHKDSLRLVRLSKLISSTNGH